MTHDRALSRRALLAVALQPLAMSCARDPRHVNLAIEWKNRFTWDDRSALERRQGVTLDSAEVDTIKGAAARALRAAFEAVPAVRVGAAGPVTDAFFVHNIERAILGESYVCGVWLCPPSRINYDLHMTLAQEYARDLGITNRQEILEAIGRGIGYTAAHEFGHRHLVAGMHRTPDARALTAGGIDAALFFGRPMYWPAEPALKDLRARFY